MNILDANGNTSLVQLRRIVPSGSAEIFVKLEGENPTGSMKDRMALAVISQAEADGRFRDKAAEELQSRLCILRKGRLRMAGA